MNNMKTTEMKELYALMDQYKLDTSKSSAYTYEDIHKRNIEMMKAVLALLAEGDNAKYEGIFWSILYDLYEDPDSYAARELGAVKCFADGLLSIKRIYRNCGLTEKMVSEYDRYRKAPIFFFPSEKNGINTSRCSAFGDRIDHTLYDLKKYFDLLQQGKNTGECKLALAYSRPETRVWLRDIGSFENLVDWFRIKGIFVNDNYEVYDIENSIFDAGKEREAYISDYREPYEWAWSEVYYNNLKTLIDRYMDKQKYFY